MAVRFCRIRQQTNDDRKTIHEPKTILRYIIVHNKGFFREGLDAEIPVFIIRGRALHTSNIVTDCDQFELEDHPVDAVRSLRVAVVGAGISGITAGILFPVRVPGINLTIYEKNNEVGGTWLENIYPGVRCDVPANVYQSTFASNTQWTEEFAQGHEIREYWQNVAKKYDVYRYIKFEKKIERTQWDQDKLLWNLQIKDIKTQEVFQEKFDILVTAIGRFYAWKLPDYLGIDNDIQVVPELQKVVKHLDHYARSPTWIAGSVGGHERKAEPMYFSPEQLEEFKDPKKYLAYRKSLDDAYWRRFAALFKDSKENAKAREEFKIVMARRLEGKPELLDSILPDFATHCRRLTPETGIETVDGVHRAVDAIICSSGANVDFASPFAIISGDVDLASAWKTGSKFGFPYSYLGIATPRFPNLFFIHGPNASGHSGTLPYSVENQVTYIARVLRKISSEGIQTIAPLKAAANDLVE
ncbi:hypothetical protein VTO42DRAFT_5943 [Malbranchea cinnamomea]